MTEFNIDFSGFKPEGKQRPRAKFKGSFGVFSPKTKFEKAFTRFLNSSDPPPYMEFCSIRAVYHFPRPKAHLGTGKNAGKVKERFADVPMKSKPDIDNVDKAVLDCLVEAGFIPDDAAVVQMSSRKEWAITPRVTVQILINSKGSV